MSDQFPATTSSTTRRFKTFAKYLNVIKTRIEKGGDTNGRKRTKNRGTQTGGDKAGRRTQKRTPARKDDEDT